MKITLLAWARESGGAERQLVNLARGLRCRGHDAQVVVFFSNPYVEAPLLAAGTPFEVLGVRGRWDVWRYLVRFLADASKRDEDILYAYLQAPNLLTLPLKLLQRQTQIVWGLRNSTLHVRGNPLSRLTAWLEARFSAAADLAIANSFRGRNDAIAQGFAPDAVVVVHNGIDTQAFRPDADGRTAFRREWAIGGDTRIIGLVGRLKSEKDHDTFLRAAAIVAKQRQDVSFLAIGAGPATDLARLQQLARHLGLESRVIWTGFRWDMPAVYNALDVATLSSVRGEGFPNTVAEAMACGLPCVVTDVGDSGLIVGDLGWVVPPRNPQALAQAWLEALAQDQTSAIRQRRRSRIQDRYSLEGMIDRSEQTLVELTEQAARTSLGYRRDRTLTRRSDDASSRPIGARPRA